MVVITNHHQDIIIDEVIKCLSSNEKHCHHLPRVQRLLLIGHGNCLRKFHESSGDFHWMDAPVSFIYSCRGYSDPMAEEAIDLVGGPPRLWTHGRL